MLGFFRRMLFEELKKSDKRGDGDEAQAQIKKNGGTRRQQMIVSSTDKAGQWKKKRSTALMAVFDGVQILAKKEEDTARDEEVGIRSQILESFLKSSHGNLAIFQRLHRDAILKDPIFYGHLSRWYHENGSVRDHQEIFTAHLLTSPYPEHRDNGMVLLQLLRPYQVARITRYSKEVLHYPTRALKTAVKFYLCRREKDPAWFDECVIRDASSMKYLYSTLHIRPDERSEMILFQNKPPVDSRVYIKKLLKSLAPDPDKQARLIMKHRIHYTSAIGAIKHYTPGIVYALVSVMTPQQVINNLKALERRGALQDPDTRVVIHEKLEYAVKESRVSDLKSMVALSKVRADGELTAKLLNVVQQRLRKRGRITEPTAIFVDKSGSMQSCIEIGKILATICSTIADSNLYVFAFDTFAFEIKSNDRSFFSWERAFTPVVANGGTSIGAPFRHLRNKQVSQILIISDGDENTPPVFKNSLKDYEKKTGKPCRVIFLKVRNDLQKIQDSHLKAETNLERDMKGEDFTVIPFNGDYYSLPNVVPLLCSGGNFELVGEIMENKLYTRADLMHLPPGFDGRTYEIL